MSVEGALVTFRVDGNDRTNETSGILFNDSLVLISGTCLLPFLQQEKWISAFVHASSPKLKTNEHIQDVIFRVFVDKRNNGKEVHCLECKAVGVWKCPLVAESLKKLFSEWALGHGNFNYELEALSNADIDLSKELMSVFILLKGGGELGGTAKNNESEDDIHALTNLLLSLDKPQRGQGVEVVSTPFGHRHFLNSLSRGLISNVVGWEECIILTDARTVSGCEGGPIFDTKTSRKKLLGIVTYPLAWWKGEWVGFTIGVSLVPVLEKLLKRENGSITRAFPNLKKSSNFSPDSSQLSFIDDIVLLVRSETSWGSGVILNAYSGIIITCSHVVKDDNRVTIFYNGNQYRAHVVFKSREDVAYDLAVIKTGSNCGFKKEAKFSKTPAKTGEVVTAAGFPFFSERDDVYIRPCVTGGCVSRVNPYMIQTTCCIQSGFSGGGLFRKGQLLGIITCNVRNTDAGALFPHINFIIPSSVFKDPVLKYIKTNDSRNLSNLECPNMKVQALWALQASKF